MQREGGVDAQRRRGVLRQRAARGGEVGSPMAGTAPRPSRPPRRMTSDEAVAARSARRRRGSRSARRRGCRSPLRRPANRRRRAGLGSGRSGRWRGLRFMACLLGRVQRRWNSGASRSRASACGPSAARSICRAVSAPSRGPRLRRPRGARASTLPAGAVGDAGRPLDALPDRVGPEPVLGAVAPAGGRGRREHAAGRARTRAAALTVGALEHALAERRAAGRVETTNSSGVFSLRRRRAHAASWWTSSR